MTTDEAKQNVNACEREIKSAYDQLVSNARDIASSGYNAAVDERKNIISEANRSTTIATLLSLTISVFGILLCIFGFYGMGVICIIAGSIVAYNVYKKCADNAQEKKKAADNIFNNVSNKETQLKSSINSNRYI